MNKLYVAWKGKSDRKTGNLFTRSKRLTYFFFCRTLFCRSTLKEQVTRG